MSRFRAPAQGKAKEAVPQDEADVVTSTRSTPPHALEALGGANARECYVEVGQYTAVNHGRRHENEDRTMYKDFGLAPGRGSSGNGQVPYCTLGILDGHDTEIASDTVAHYLPDILAKHYSAGESVVDAYTAAMEECEELLKTLASTAGTCVLSCTIAGGYVWCANLGDCRSAMAILQVGTQSAGRTAPKVKVKSLTWLSRDQKASTADERKRIRDAGGTVVDGRVEGLEPSRTLGDFDVKANVNKGVISIIPEVRRWNLGSDTNNTAQAIIVCATDGVWDVISGQDVCDLIQSRAEIANLQETIGKIRRPNLEPLAELAKDLVEFSVARGSRDDCTAIVALVSVPPS